MDPARRIDLLSVETYLKTELSADCKSEYVGGAVYAMAGGSNKHNQIASNVLIALGSRLRGHRCRAFNSDVKIRLRMLRETRFYYPDVSVVCRPNPPEDTFQDEPAVIVEVASPSTRRVDEGEKKDSYLTLPTLSAYIILEQDAAAAIVYRRTDHGFEREQYSGPEAVISLPEIEQELPLSEVYDGVLL